MFEIVVLYPHPVPHFLSLVITPRNKPTLNLATPLDALSSYLWLRME